MPDMPDENPKTFAGLFAVRQALTVSELNGKISNNLERDFGRLIVEGEISSFSVPVSGHWYFSLKDSDSQIQAVCFKFNNRLIPFKPRVGLSVIVRGRLTVYQPKGTYQILVETIEPIGAGALQLAFEQQVRRLEAEGLFDPARKRRLPLLPRRIGIVTSPTGAAIRDILQILERRNRGLDIVIAPARVQGEGAAGEIAEAITLLNRLGSSGASGPGVDRPIDVLIVGRGGGSKEDLWAFNEEVVARAIHQSAIPVISAVGHETDTTVADLVADVRAATPSAAAELVSAGAADLMLRVDDLDRALGRAMQHFLLRRRAYWRSLVTSQAMTATVGRVQSGRRRLDHLKSASERALLATLTRFRQVIHHSQLALARIDLRQNLLGADARLARLDREQRIAIDLHLARQRQRLSLAAGQLNMLSPLAVLGRGYTMTTDERGRLVARAGEVVAGQQLVVSFADGQVDCQAIDVRLAAMVNDDNPDPGIKKDGD